MIFLLEERGSGVERFSCEKSGVRVLGVGGAGFGGRGRGFWGSGERVFLLVRCWQGMRNGTTLANRCWWFPLVLAKGWGCGFGGFGGCDRRGMRTGMTPR